MISKDAAMNRLLLLSLCALLVAAVPLRAETPPIFDRAQRADGARVAPDQFVRAYDPVTVFFPSDVGPKNGGAENSQQKFVTIIPQPAGEWRWIGSRALQFRPADAWKPLQRVDMKLGAAETRLVALPPTPPIDVSHPERRSATPIDADHAHFPRAGRHRRARAAADDRNASVARNFAARRSTAQRRRTTKSARWNGATVPRTERRHTISRADPRRTRRDTAVAACRRARARRRDI